MSYQVPMDEVAVTVALLGTAPAEHFCYLHQFSDRREGPETLSDYLNSGRSFFPMMCGGVPKMVNREQMMWVRFERLPDIVERDGTLIEKLSILELTDGSRIEGSVPIDRPPDVSRISDLLNDPLEIFLRIDAESDTYYVNKKFIRVLIPR